MGSVRLKFISMTRDAFLHCMNSLPAIASALWLLGSAADQSLTVGIHRWIGYEKITVVSDVKTISTFLFNTGLLKLKASLNDLVSSQWAAERSKIAR